MTIGSTPKAEPIELPLKVTSIYYLVKEEGKKKPIKLKCYLNVKNKDSW